MACVAFVVGFWPIERAGDRWWSMPITGRLVLVFSGVCCIMLAITYLVDRGFKKWGKKSN
jgi:hypothetical protein